MGGTGVNGHPRALEADAVEDDLRAAVARLEHANEQLARENNRLAHVALGRAGAPAAVELTRTERHWRERAEEAELEADRLRRLLDTPRHKAVEGLRDRLACSPRLFGLAQSLFGRVTRR